jgi:hypothetical protein
LLYLWLCGEKARKVYKRAFFIYFIEWMNGEEMIVWRNDVFVFNVMLCLCFWCQMNEKHVERGRGVDCLFDRNTSS